MRQLFQRDNVHAELRSVAAAAAYAALHADGTKFRNAAKTRVHGPMSADAAE